MPPNRRTSGRRHFATFTGRAGYHGGVNRFLGNPTRGGWLTLLNAFVLGAVFTFNALWDTSVPWLIVPLYLAFSLPLGLTLGLALAAVLP